MTKLVQNDNNKASLHRTKEIIAFPVAAGDFKCDWVQLDY